MSVNKHLYAEYANPFLGGINWDIINRKMEKPLSDYVISCFESIGGVLDNVEMIHAEYITDPFEVNANDFSRKSRRRPAGKKKDDVKYFNIAETLRGIVIMKFRVILDDGEEKIYTVRMLVPIPDKNNYYLINGKRNVMQYQIVDSSVYTTSNELVQKSVLSIRIIRESKDFESIDDIKYTLNLFMVKSFNKYVNIMGYYFPAFGWEETLKYWDVDTCIELVETISDDMHQYVYFRVAPNVYLKVGSAYLEHSYIQGMVGTILDAIPKDATYADIMNEEYWITQLVKASIQLNMETKIRYGKNAMTYFKRLLDQPTKDVLRLEDRNKESIHACVRWLVQHYSDLRNRDNLDLANKRLRCNEYIASLLNDTISTKIMNFINRTSKPMPEPKDEADRLKKEKAQKDNLTKQYNILFNFSGNELISNINISGMGKVDDAVNEADLFTKLKVTSKGPTAQGNKNGRNISSVNRAPHVSFIGKFDLWYCSSSSPGLTNYLSPFVATDGLYFEGAAPEPEYFRDQFLQELDRIRFNEETGEVSQIVGFVED